MSSVGRFGLLFVGVAACSQQQPSISAVGAGGSGSPPSTTGGSGGADPGDGGSPSGGSNGGGSGGAAGGGFGGVGGSYWPDAGATPDANSSKNCGLQTIDLKRTPAELLLVLDRSGSMNQSVPGSPNSKWVDVTTALEEVVMKTDAVVAWGLKTFPSDDVCGVADGLVVPTAISNYGTMLAAINMNPPAGGGTPTTIGVQKAVAALQMTPSKGQRYLVLATDGLPNCRSLINTSQPDDMAAVQAVADAATAGIPTFVIGIATNQMADGTLNMLADAGGRPRMANPKYYLVSTKADFIGALTAITGQISDCRFPLDKNPPSPDDVAVKIAGTKVNRDPAHMNGWDYSADKKSIQIYGAACTQLQMSTMNQVSIVFGCPGVVIP